MNENAFAAVELDAPPPTPVKMPLTGLFGAMAFPGVGHALVGRWQRGAIWLAAYLLFASLAIVSLVVGQPIKLALLFFGVMLVARLFEIVDATLCGRRPRWQYGNGFTRALLVVGVFIVGYFPALGMAHVLRYALLEAFVIPNNSMLPALVGESVWGRCTSCQQRILLVPRDRYRVSGSPEKPAGICPHCTAQPDAKAYPEGELEPHGKDRILVNKRLAPRRWELIVFRAPDDPRRTFVMRLVGLPGETVELHDGKVAINGRPIQPPADLAYLHYVDASAVDGTRGWADRGSPVKLGPGEYFVLGDFSQRSLDSRFWDTGAPGHPPYAVPTDHIIGVVTHIYWPLDRQRTFERPPADE
jgi:signal peptidase I